MTFSQSYNSRVLGGIRDFMMYSHIFLTVVSVHIFILVVQDPVLYLNKNVTMNSSPTVPQHYPSCTYICRCLTTLYYGSIKEQASPNDNPASPQLHLSYFYTTHKAHEKHF